jgi:hypothetical protein
MLGGDKGQPFASSTCLAAEMQDGAIQANHVHAFDKVRQTEPSQVRVAERPSTERHSSDVPQWVHFAKWIRRKQSKGRPDDGFATGPRVAKLPGT